MKLLPNHPRFDHHGQHRHEDRKSRKIAKKIAKLEKMLSKYNFDDSPGEESCTSDASNRRSRSLSRSHKRHRGHGGRGAVSRDSSSSSSSSGSSADSSASSSTASSRSPSPCDRRSHHPHHRRAATPEHRRSHRFRHRGRAWRRRCRRLHDGLRGFFAVLEPESESSCRPTAPDRSRPMDLAPASRSASRERQAQSSPTKLEVGEDIETIQRDSAERGLAAGARIDEALAENWTRILREGMPAGTRSDLLKKYPVSENCALLKGPRLHGQLLPVATKAAIDVDGAQVRQQDRLGTGLAALGKAITDLNNATELKKNQQVLDVLEELNEAAAIIVDAHHSVTKTRQAFMQSQLNKRVRAVVENCQRDEYLYGKDFEKIIENVGGFRKYKRGGKKSNRDERSRRKHSHLSSFHGATKTNRI